MTISKPSIVKKTPSLTKYVCGGNRSKTTKIIWHYTGKNDVRGIDTINNWFNRIAKGYIQNGKYVYASSNFVMDLDGTTYEYIPMNKISYASNSANSYSVGIECATTGSNNHYSDKEYKSMVHLGAWLSQEYKLDPRKDFLTHTDIVGKSYKLCPIYFVNNPKKFEQFKLDCYNLLKGIIKLEDIKNCTNGQTTVVSSQPKPDDKPNSTGSYIVRYLQTSLNENYNCKLAVDGSFGKLTQAQVEKNYLNKGDKGEHVIWLQKALCNRGFKVDVDGSFGNATLDALKKYQKSRGLKADGCGGVATHKAIIND